MDEKDQQMNEVVAALEANGHEWGRVRSKIFNGKSIGQLIADGEYQPEHLVDLLYKCGIMKKGYAALSAMGLHLLPFRPNWERYFNDPHSLNRELNKIKEAIAGGQEPMKAARAVFEEGNFRHEHGIEGKQLLTVMMELDAKDLPIKYIDMKMFDGKSILELIMDWEYKPEHLQALLKECAIIKKNYDKSGLAQSKARPTSDWQSDVSIPGGGE